MNVKLFFLNLSLLVSFGAQGLNWQRKDVLRPLAQKPTTVLVCMMEGGKSASAINFDLQEMQKIGSNENMNVLVWAALDADLDKSAYALVVQKGQVFQDGEILKKDGGEAQAIIDACTWAHGKFPSDNFVLILHNRGLKYFNEYDLRKALAHVVTIRNKPIDIVAFNASMMATIEIASAIQPYAQYLVASEGIIPGKWYPYNAALRYGAKWNHAFTPYKMVLDMVNEYESMYQEKATDYTLSGMDLSAALGLCHAIDALAANLIVLLDLPDQVVIHRIIEASCNVGECTRFASLNYIDLGHFLNNLQANLARAKRIDKELIKQVHKDVLAAKRALSRCVVECVYGSDFPDATGLTICMGHNSSLEPDYVLTQWAQNTRWAQMLEAYAAVR